jgi:hypothetical protein|nr:MAG TPA: hypothetical protein [Caudoviricetes sp.]
MYEIPYQAARAERQIPLNRMQAQTLTAFRRSNYANEVRDILYEALAVAREENETKPANEGERLRVLAVRSVLSLLFDAQITLKQGARP